MKKHVFICAVSTFPPERPDGVTVLEQTRYRFTDKSVKGPGRVFSYDGRYQLEPIPIFIRDKLGEDITDIVLLETRAARDPKSDGRAAVYPAPDGQGLWPAAPGGPGTAARWYKEWLALRFPEASVRELPIDERAPAASLEKTIRTIRRLYAQTDTPEEWRLWIDTHGAFRDISEVLATAARLFTIEKDPIRTDGIYSVYHSTKTRGNRRTPSRIVNLTPFYFSESAKALKGFLNYGQYLTMRFRPCDGRGPYCFISYRHDPKLLVAVRTVFGKLQEHGIEYWFDDGIRAGTDWAAALEQRNREAAVFVGLLSGSYFRSAECWKELLRAVAGAKAGEKTLCFFLLEEKLRVPVSVPAGAGFREARELQRSLGLTDGDLRAALCSTVQHIQFYKYVYRNEERQINERDPADAELAEDLEALKRLLEQDGSRIARKEATVSL